MVAEAGPAPRPRWPFLVLIVLGVLLFALPVLTGMFTRAAGGQQLLTEFHPFVSTEVLAKFHGYLTRSMPRAPTYRPPRGLRAAAMSGWIPL